MNGQKQPPEVIYIKNFIKLLKISEYSIKIFGALGFSYKYYLIGTIVCYITLGDIQKVRSLRIPEF